MLASFAIQRFDASPPPLSMTNGLGRKLTIEPKYAHITMTACKPNLLYVWRFLCFILSFSLLLPTAAVARGVWGPAIWTTLVSTMGMQLSH